jgi:hypothetical protein
VPHRADRCLGVEVSLILLRAAFLATPLRNSPLPGNTSFTSLSSTKNIERGNVSNLE